MKITIGGKAHSVKKFTPRMVIEADRLLQKGTSVSLGDEPEFFDEVVPFISDTVFAGQFTADEFMESYESATVMADILGMLGAVRGIVGETLAEFPLEPDPDEQKNAKGQAGKKNG
jgi:hypothetical protein